jgi:hypothetical protein
MQQTVEMEVRPAVEPEQTVQPAEVMIALWGEETAILVQRQATLSRPKPAPAPRAIPIPFSYD